MKVKLKNYDNYDYKEFEILDSGILIATVKYWKYRGKEDEFIIHSSFYKLEDLKKIFYSNDLIVYQSTLSSWDDIDYKDLSTPFNTVNSKHYKKIRQIKDLTFKYGEATFPKLFGSIYIIRHLDMPIRIIGIEQCQDMYNNEFLLATTFDGDALIVNEQEYFCLTIGSADTLPNKKILFDKQFISFHIRDVAEREGTSVIVKYHNKIVGYLYLFRNKSKDSIHILPEVSIPFYAWLRANYFKSNQYSDFLNDCTSRGREFVPQEIEVKH